jgi:DNA-binding transcriptional ArsR family regulator
VSGKKKGDRTTSLNQALSHPLRCSILRRLRNGRVATPNDLAQELDEPLSNVSYHFRQLAECGCIKLVKTKPAGGSVAHFYKRTIKEKWALNALGKEGG